MGWANQRGYSPGKRHYYPEGFIITPGEVKTRADMPESEWRYYSYRPVVPALCGNVLQGTGYDYFKGDKPGHKYSGVSEVEQVNLNQRNLCSYCVKKFVNEVRPELLPAYQAMRTGVLS